MSAHAADVEVTPADEPSSAPSGGAEPESRSRSPWRAIFLGLLSLLFLAPLLWMASTSLKSTAEVSQAELSFLPGEVSTEGYQKILDAPQTPVGTWFLNSMLAATGQTLLVLVTATMAAYALARLSFPGKKVLTGLVLATLFVPPISLLIPNYVIVSELGWLDSLSAVIVPGAAGAFGVFFLRQFFLGLPIELEEAALLDGASRFKIFLTIIVPLSRPALATLALLTFLSNWNDFLWPLYVLFSPERLTIQPGLSTLQSAYTTDYATILAGGAIASIPVLILFLISQRFVIEGIARGGVKG
ncbi:carbohydrate ABC transporter permease [Knoellia aerolata]|uniref:ABC transporter permease n=1 Tax=Knoellia aerolata DSM 18566 TaxID=1385519 RepID=A0A0A0K0A0_9MICO|nr:carbohydrate ABC transporter permease [Knoellia aerolata]KGN41211.1 ABC transporter permease [Knoellia aerolata DSM 18566]